MSVDLSFSHRGWKEESSQKRACFFLPGIFLPGIFTGDFCSKSPVKIPGKTKKVMFLRSEPKREVFIE